MSDVSSKVTWRDGMAFEAWVGCHHFPIDADPGFGGRELGPKPKGLLLTALIGCTAMDVIAILQKMKVVPERFEVEAEGDLADAHPKRYTAARLVYRFEGEELPVAKLRKAVNLSQERYCGVMATLRDAMPIEARLVLNGQELPLDAPIVAP